MGRDHLESESSNESYLSETTGIRRKQKKPRCKKCNRFWHEDKNDSRCPFYKAPVVCVTVSSNVQHNFLTFGNVYLLRSSMINLVQFYLIQFDSNQI